MSRRSGKNIRRILITAGPTRERIDPIRFISNYSTGTFGYEIAKEAKRRGHAVTLVSGPTALKAPKGIRFIRVESAMDMRSAVLREAPRSGSVIMAAAISDWRPASVATRKIKKGSKRMTLELVRNPDIIAELGRKKGPRALVGFALETEDIERNALRKLKAKNLDFIVASRRGPGSPAFGGGKMKILVMDRFGLKEKITGKTKRELAKIILDKLEAVNI